MNPAGEEVDSRVKNFFDAIGLALPGYRHAAISFVAIEHEGYETILRASLRLSMESIRQSRPERFIFGLRAAQLPFPGAGAAVRGVVFAIFKGAPILVGNHTLRLLADSTRGYSPHHENSAQFKLRTNEYGDRLIVGGMNPWPLLTPRQQELDRALQAQAFDSLQDLLHEYGFSPFDMSAECSFEVVAGPVARIESSSVTAGSATVSVRLASGLQPEAFQLTLRDAVRNKGATRRTIDALNWTSLADHSSATATFEVPRDAFLECRALYAGQIQDVKPLFDHAFAPNPRRLAVELNDPELVTLTKVLTTIRERDDKLRNEFEASVAVLFYLLGFEAVRTSGNRRATDGPDTYALTDSNELLVIESTSGAFSDEKCAKLITRVKDAREIWARARPDLEDPQVVGVIVTARERDALVSQLAAVEQQGVLILCHAEIVEAIERTRFAPSPRQILDEWRKRPMLQVMTQGVGPAGIA